MEERTGTLVYKRDSLQSSVIFWRTPACPDSPGGSKETDVTPKQIRRRIQLGKFKSQRTVRLPKIEQRNVAGKTYEYFTRLGSVSGWSPVRCWEMPVAFGFVYLFWKKGEGYSLFLPSATGNRLERPELKKHLSACPDQLSSDVRLWAERMVVEARLIDPRPK